MSQLNTQFGPPMVPLESLTPAVLAAVHALPEALAEEFIRDGIIELASRTSLVKRLLHSPVGQGRCTTILDTSAKQFEHVCHSKVAEVQHPTCGKLKAVSCVNDVECTHQSYYVEGCHLWFNPAPSCDGYIETVHTCTPDPEACYVDEVFLKMYRAALTNYAIGRAMAMPDAEVYNPSAAQANMRAWAKVLPAAQVSEIRGGSRAPLSPQPRSFV